MTSPNSAQSLGVAYSLGASALFAVLYYYATLLQLMAGEQIFGWRILLTVPFAALFLVASRQCGQVADIVRRVAREPLLWVALPASAALLNVQLWLFMWAPVNGYALDVSLGYFLLPLTLVATSRLVFREPITRLQTIACALAAVGVVCELALARSVSWPAFVVCLAYPVYYMLRRRLRTDSQGGMLVDMALATPVGLYFIATIPGAAIADSGTFALVLGLGAISAAALGLMITASQRLSLALFGLLSYVEPILLVLVAILLGERIEGLQWLTYSAIWAAVALLAWEGVRSLRKGAGG